MDKTANLPDMRPVLRRADACTRDARVPWTTVADLEPGDKFVWFGSEWHWTGDHATNSAGRPLELPATERVEVIP